MVDKPRMGPKRTVDWVRNEWGIFRKGGEMGWGQRAQWFQQWVPFGMRTVGWGTMSVTLGPFTGGRVSTWCARRWSASSAQGLRIDIAATGQENVPEGGFVYASNHESLVDILVLGASLPGDFKWAAKRSVMNVPFLGWHLRLAGHVPVDRNKGRDAAVAVMEAFESVLRRNKPLLVFPEGTRTADGKLKPFKNGAFQAAVNTGKPVLPVAINGTFSLMSRDAVDTGASKNREDRLVTVQIGKPLHRNPDLTDDDAVIDLRDRTRAAVVELLEAIGSTAVAVEPSPQPETKQPFHDAD
jgi:1-acyl-sn-glycerol-3-phosphate acyltransferase